jgi:transcriptional regulator with XRE-family HTH domain
MNAKITLPSGLTQDVPAVSAAPRGKTIGQVVASNVRRWRDTRQLDQQDLADRLCDLGWQTDQPTVARIERGKRKVSVDDLAVLAVALNVPPPLLLLPVHDAESVALTPKGTSPVYAWDVFEWMVGNEPLPGRDSVEWRTGAEPLWLYDKVRIALRYIKRDDESQREKHGSLRLLVDAVARLEEGGLSATGLVTEELRREIDERGITPTKWPERAEPPMEETS